MLNPYGNVLVFLLAGFGAVWFSMMIVKLLAPHRPDAAKLSTYECGETPVGSGWINFNARFYLIAILFIVFDVEIVLILPVVAIFRESLLSGSGGPAFLEIFLFAGILFLGLVYAWRNGYLEWLKKLRRQLRVERPVLRLKDILNLENGKGG